MSELQNLYCLLLAIRTDDDEAARAIEQALYILDKMMGGEP
jgi:hypothetical protein